MEKTTAGDDPERQRVEQAAANARQMFGQYEILETVGQGGMGVVYRAYDTVLKRTVALKILRDDLRDQAHLVARFQREAEAFATLNHPNIVHIYSVGRIGRIPFIAMECIEGLPLSRVLRNERRIPWPRALQIAHEIARALACAHRAQIIHRDIKPGNIIIGNDGHAYVTDFGIAKVLNAETQLTVDGARLGTPQYMSPERCQNRETTAASDIYSLGIMLFQMIAGRLPFQSDSATTLIQQIMAGSPPRLCRINPDVPESVDRLVAYMIEKKPEDRPVSAAVLCEILARVQEGKSLTERDGDTVQAIRSYKEALATPTPNVESSPVRRRRRRVFGLDGAFPRRWWRSKRVQYAAVGVIACAVAVFSYWIDTFRVPPARHALPQDVRAWQYDGAVAYFVDEGPGVLVGHVQLPDFTVDQVRWLGTRALAVVARGRGGSPRTNETALVVLDLGARTGSLVAPPFISASPEFPLIVDEQGALFGVWGDAITPLYNAPQLVWSAAPPRSAIESVFAGRRLSEAVVARSAPDGSLVAVAAPNSRDSRWSLEIFARDGRLLATVPCYGAVTGISWSRDAGRLSYIELSQSGARQLWWATVNAALVEPKLVATGDLLPETGLFDPSGSRVLVATRQPNGSRIAIASIAGYGEPVDIGAASDGGWDAAGNVVAAAEDNQGRMQLWQIKSDPPYDRSQLTFLSSGTRAVCRTSDEGAWAVSVVDDAAQPAVVVVNLQP